MSQGQGLHALVLHRSCGVHLPSVCLKLVPKWIWRFGWDHASEGGLEISFYFDLSGVVSERLEYLSISNCKVSTVICHWEFVLHCDLPPTSSGLAGHHAEGVVELFGHAADPSLEHMDTQGFVKHWFCLSISSIDQAIDSFSHCCDGEV